MGFGRWREGGQGHWENHPVGTWQLWEAEPVHGEQHQLLPQGEGHQALPPAQPKPPELCCFSLFSSHCLTAANSRSDLLSQRFGSGDEGVSGVCVWFGWRVPTHGSATTLRGDHGSAGQQRPDLLAGTEVGRCWESRSGCPGLLSPQHDGSIPTSPASPPTASLLWPWERACVYPKQP